MHRLGGGAIPATLAPLLLTTGMVNERVWQMTQRKTKGQLALGIAAWLAKEEATRKQRLLEYYNAKYNAPKTIEFPKQNINMERHFNFPKFIESPGFQSLTKNALAVYPVFCALADFEHNDWFQVSRDHVAKFTGINPRSVDLGINEIIAGWYVLGENEKSAPLLERKFVTAKRSYYLYRVGFIRKDMVDNYKGQYFKFYTCIIDSGIWARLTPRAKALYIVMRTVAKFDIAAANIERTYDEPFTGADFSNREWDVCTVPLARMCDMVGIEVTNIRSVLHQLEHYTLIERIGSAYYNVYLKPQPYR